MNIIAIALSAATAILSPTEKDAEIKNIHGIMVLDINNQEVNLSDYEGKVLLIVNVASKCGLLIRGFDAFVVGNDYPHRTATAHGGVVLKNAAADVHGFI